MDIQDNSGKLKSSDVRTSTDFLRGLLLKADRFEVVDKSRQEEKRRAVIEELKLESGDGCYDDKCRVKLGRELAADTALVCIIGAIGATCTLTCELIPLEKATADASGVAEFQCDADGLLVGLKKVASQLAVGLDETSPATRNGSHNKATSSYDQLMAKARALEQEKKEHGRTTARARTELPGDWSKVGLILSKDSLPVADKMGFVELFLSKHQEDNPYRNRALALLDALRSGRELPEFNGPPPVDWVHSKAAGIGFMRTEATVTQFMSCIEAGYCSSKHFNTIVDFEYCNLGSPNREAHPANCVDWQGAAAFCEWVGGRLPTDSEWRSEASEAGTREYPWGGLEPSCALCIMFDSEKGCGTERTWPVCSKPDGNSATGLCDMSGSVAEWTSTLEDGQRILCGGSWQSTWSEDLSASSIRRVALDYWGSSIGFRCVR